MNRDERWSLDRPQGSPSQSTGADPFARDHAMPSPAPEVEVTQVFISDEEIAAVGRASTQGGADCVLLQKLAEKLKVLRG